MLIQRVFDKLRSAVRINQIRLAAVRRTSREPAAKHVGEFAMQQVLFHFPLRTIADWLPDLPIWLYFGAAVLCYVVGYRFDQVRTQNR